MSGKKSTGKTGRPVRVPGEKPTAEKIFDAAVDLFAERGYDRTSVRDIAKAAGITEGAVYRHYPSKEAILDAICTYVETHVYTPPPVPGIGDPGETSVFREILESLPGIIMTDPYMIKLVHIAYREMYHNEKIRDFVRSQFGERADDYTEAMFRAYMEAGAIRPCDPRALAQLFNGFRSAWFNWTFLIEYDKPKDVDQMVRELQGPIKLFEDLLTPEKK